MTEEEAHERIRQAYLAALDAAKKHPKIKEAFEKYIEMASNLIEVYIKEAQFARLREVAATIYISALQNPDATEEQKNAAFIEWQNKIKKFNDNNQNPTS